MAFFKRFRLRRGERHFALHPLRRWMRFVIIATISVAGMLGMAYLLRVPLRDDLIRQALALAEKQGFGVDYKSVWGDVFGGINFSELRVFQDEDHYLEAERVNLSYRLIPFIMERRLDIRSVRLVRPRIRWILPEQKEEQEPLDPDFSLDLADFHIRSGQLVLADTLSFESIQVDLTLRVRPHKVSGRLRRGSVLVRLNDEERLNLRSAKTSFSYIAPDTLHLEDLLLLTERSRIKGTLDLEGIRWGVNLKEADIDLGELDPTNLEGRLFAEGSVTEEKGGYGGKFSLDLKDLRYDNLRLADASMKISGKEGLFDISLTANDANLGTIDARGTARLDTVSVSTDLELLDVKLLPAPSWPISLRGDISATYLLKEKRGNAQGSFTDVLIRSMAWEECRAAVEIDDQTINLKELLLTHDFTSIQGNGVFSPDTVVGSLAVQSFQLSSLGEFNPLKAAAEMDAELTVKGSKDRPQISGVVLVRSDEAFFSKLEVELDEFAPLSMQGIASLDITGIPGPRGSKINVSALLKDEYLELSAKGGADISLLSRGTINLDFKSNEYQYECQRLELVVGTDTIENRYSFIAGQSGDSLYLSPTFLFVGKGELGVSAAFRPRHLPRLELSLYDIELSTLARILNMPEEIGGRIWGQVASRGSLDDRTILIDLGASDLHLAELNADSLYFTGTLDTTRLEFEATLVGDGRSTAQGFLYYDLADSMPVKSFDVAVSLEDIGVRPFRFLKDIVDVRSGDIRGNLHATGTFAEPAISGQINVRDAELYVPVIALTGNPANLDLIFSPTGVVVDNIDANVESPEGPGHIEGKGDYALFTSPHRFHFGFRFRDVPYEPDRRLSAICGGKLYIDGSDVSPLEITGEITVKQALIKYNLGDEIRVTAIGAPVPDPSKPPPPPTYVDLEIQGDKNIWIRNRDLYAEVVPDLRIVQRDEIMPQITGELTVKRGNFYYLDHQLRLDPSRSKIIFPPTQELDPELDIWASKQTDKLASSGATPQRIEIIIHMGGRLTEPVLEFYSEPPEWSESEILTYLNTTLGGAYITKLLLGAANPIQERVGLDVVEIQNIGLTTEPTKVTFGKYISDRLFASYTYALTKGADNPNQHQFMVEYDIDTTKHNQQIILERDEYGTQSLRYQIKLRY